MAESPGIYRWPTYFHKSDSSDVLYQEDEGLLTLPVGAGVLVLGECYRVVDTWFSYDHHGVFNLGWHVFLERATEEDNRLQRLAPDYFRNDPEA
ncbi:hypothetical protein ACH4EC_37955 [Streptomyces anulatus]